MRHDKSQINKINTWGLKRRGAVADAKFWVGRGSRPSPQGVRVPDENGKEVPLRRYDRKTIVLTLPRDLTVFDIGHFGVWCEAFTVDFGHIRIPAGLNVPPSLKMLGVAPQVSRESELQLMSQSDTDFELLLHLKVQHRERARICTINQTNCDQLRQYGIKLRCLGECLHRQGRMR
jgi:hypothetical protein